MDMDSPRFYESSPGLPEPKKLNYTVPQQVPFGALEQDITNLDAPEVSFDLQNYISSENQATPVYFDSLIEGSKNLASSSATVLTSTTAPLQYPRGQAGGYTNISSSGYTYTTASPTYTNLPIKIESENDLCRQSQLGSGGTLLGELSSSPANSYSSNNYIQFAPSPVSSNGGGVKSTKSSRPKKGSEKNTEEYRKRRDRNNIAVRKSREKAKVRSQITEEKVRDLVKENEMLKSTVGQLSKELDSLKSIFANASERLDPDISRRLFELRSSNSFQMEQ